MSALNKFLIFAGIFVVGVFGLLAWHTYIYRPAEAAKFAKENLTTVTKEDMEMLLKGLSPQQLQQIASDPEGKKKVTEELSQLLAVASAARKAGVADDPEVKKQLEFIDKQILAVQYDREKTEGQPAPPLSFAKQEDVDAFLAKPETEGKFNEFFENFKKSQKMPAEMKVPEAQLKQLKEGWAKINILYDMAKKDTGLSEEFSRKVELQTKIQQAQFLAQTYAEDKLSKSVEPTKAEIDEYIKSHPEYDPSTKKAKAEEILARVKAGEDFAKLADEFSEDPGNKRDGKNQGGLYEGITKGQFDPAFENAALALQPGQATDSLVETQFGYHIIKLESRKTEKDKDGKDVEKYNVRHILISTTEPDAGQNPMGPPQSMEETVKGKIADEKRKKVLDEVLAENPITVAQDFEIKVPPMPQSDELPDFDNPPGNPKGKPQPAGKNPPPMPPKSAPKK